MNPGPIVLIVIAIVIVWAFFETNSGASHKGSGATDPEAARQKAQAIKEAAIQSVIDAEARGEIDVKTRNSQIAHLSRLPTNPQDGPGGSR